MGVDASLTVITPESAAVTSLRDLGHDYITNGALIHEVIAWFAYDFWPVWFRNWYFNRLANYSI